MAPVFIKLWHKTILKSEQCEEMNLLKDKQIFTYEEVIKGQLVIIDTLKSQTKYLRYAIAECDSIKEIDNQQSSLYLEEIDIQKSKKHLWQGVSGISILLLILSVL